MAYVGISGALLNEVAGNINRLREVELAQLGETHPFHEKIVQDQGVRIKIDEHLWHGMNDLRDRLTPYNRDGVIRLAVNLGQLVPDTAHQTFTAMFKADNIPCFAPFKGYDRSTVELTLPADAVPLFAEVKELVTSRLECTTRWNKVKDQVGSFLEKCKSLNEAVKLWPDVVRYIPKEYVDRLNRKVEKSAASSSAAEALKNVDTDLAAASLVLARMAGAKVNA